MPVTHLHVFSGKISIQVFYSFLFFYIELYELFVYFGNLIACHLHHLQIFSPFCRLSFHFVILLMASFAMQKVLSLIRYHLFIFAFTSFALGD